jgi:chromosome segregation ATPase
LIYCALYLAAVADASELEAAKKRIAELESQLGEKDGQLGQKATQLEEAKTENARLSQVETELHAQVQKLTSDRAAATAAHTAELQRLQEVWATTEGQLVQGRDLAVKRCEEIDGQYQDQIRAAQAKYDLSLACLHRADLALAGMPRSLTSLLFRTDFLFLRSNHSFWLTVARCLAELLFGR